MLSRRTIAATISVLVTSGLGAQQTAPTALTLGDAARLAAKQSTPALAAQFRAREAAARVTQTRAELLPTFSTFALQSGHTINLEEPALFNDAVLEFLRMVEADHWGRRPSVTTSLLPA